METIKLGRLHSNDDRDQQYLMRQLIPAESPGITYKYWWANGYWGDQGNTPQCVGYSWTHFLTSGPITQNSSFMGDPPINPTIVYKEAQKVDVWPGENYAGTSVRAGAKILKKEEFISGYYWAWNVADIVQTLLTTGPVVIGVNWYSSMFYPDRNGIISVNGNVVGGHAILVDGVNTKKGFVRLKNSWGRSWGKNGFAYLSIDDLETLLSQNGEACLAVEIEKG